VNSLLCVKIKFGKKSNFGEIYELKLTNNPHHCCVNKGPEDENIP
jgi:hypothetical protein